MDVGDESRLYAGESVLVNAATGYIGAHLLRPLLDAGYRVRASARRPEAVKAPDGVEVVAADAFDPTATRASLEGTQSAFYLVHTLGGGADYAERDRAAATIFARAAADAGVSRIVFLGGLGKDVSGLSEHLSSTGFPGVAVRLFCGHHDFPNGGGFPVFLPEIQHP